MTLVLKDRVKETTSTTGTGTWTLAGAVSGFQAFSAIGNANTTYYSAYDVLTGAWEVGLGTYTLSGTTLARTTVLSSSNSGSLVNFTNAPTVWCDLPASIGSYAPVGTAIGNVPLSTVAGLATWSPYTMPATVGAAANVLRSDGTNFLSASLAAADLSNGVTGSGAVMLAASPTTTGTLGAAAILATALITGLGFIATGSSGVTNGLGLAASNNPAIYANSTKVIAALSTGAQITGNLTISSLTSGRVPYASTAGLLIDSASFKFNTLAESELIAAGFTPAGLVTTGLGLSGGNSAIFNSGSVVASFASTGIIFTDNTYDIGASGATRPRTGYFGTSIISPVGTFSGVLTGAVVNVTGTTGIATGIGLVASNTFAGYANTTEWVRSTSTLTTFALATTITGALTVNNTAAIAGPSLGAASTASFLSITGTWNDSGTAFKGALLVNVTNTASAVASSLLDLQVGGTSKFSVNRGGAIYTPLGTLGGLNFGDGSTYAVYQQSTYIVMWTGGAINWAFDGILFRGAQANVIGLCSGSVAGTALSVGWSQPSAGVWAAGTGAAGSTAAEVRAAFFTPNSSSVVNGLGLVGSNNPGLYANSTKVIDWTSTAINLAVSTTYTSATAGPILKQGANGRVGTFTANGVTPVTVTNSSVAATDFIGISLNTAGGTVSVVEPTIATLTAGVGFTVVAQTLDTSVYNYVIIKNAA